MTTQVDVISRGPKRVRVIREFLTEDGWSRKPAEFKESVQPVDVATMAYVHKTERLVIEEE